MSQKKYYNISKPTRKTSILFAHLRFFSSSNNSINLMEVENMLNSSETNKLVYVDLATVGKDGVTRLVRVIGTQNSSVCFMALLGDQTQENFVSHFGQEVGLRMFKEKLMIAKECKFDFSENAKVVEEGEEFVALISAIPNTVAYNLRTDASLTVSINLSEKHATGNFAKLSFDYIANEEIEGVITDNFYTEFAPIVGFANKEIFKGVMLYYKSSTSFIYVVFEKILAKLNFMFGELSEENKQWLEDMKKNGMQTMLALKPNNDEPYSMWDFVNEDEDAEILAYEKGKIMFNVSFTEETAPIYNFMKAIEVVNPDDGTVTIEGVSFNPQNFKVLQVENSQSDIQNLDLISEVEDSNEALGMAIGVLISKKFL